MEKREVGRDVTMTYTEKFREEVVLYSMDHSLKETAAKFRIPVGTIGYWRHAFNNNNLPVSDGRPVEDNNKSGTTILKRRGRVISRETARKLEEAYKKDIAAEEAEDYMAQKEGKKSREDNAGVKTAARGIIKAAFALNDAGITINFKEVLRTVDKTLAIEISKGEQK